MAPQVSAEMVPELDATVECFLTALSTETVGSPGFAEAFLVDGKLPGAGTQRKSLKLADTLSQLAHAGLADFYRGDVARELAADFDRVGSPVTRPDLERTRATIADVASAATDSISA